jgi:hypothetical protein
MSEGGDAIAAAAAKGGDDVSKGRQPRHWSPDEVNLVRSWGDQEWEAYWRAQSEGWPSPFQNARLSMRRLRRRMR